MNLNLKKYFLCLPALSYLFMAVLMPYLHMGGIVCPHHPDHAFASHLCCESESEAGAPTYRNACGDDADDDADCQICSFLANCSAVSGIVSFTMFTYHANFAYESTPAEINLPGKIYSANPSTAPPSFI